MDNNNEIIQQSLTSFEPEVGTCYQHGWQKLWKYFLELFLIVIIYFFISLPGFFLKISEDIGGIVVLYLIIFSLAYTILLAWPIKYGVSFAYLKAARGEKLEIKNMFDVFQNYWNAVLACLLVAVVVGIGVVFFIVPGIIFACKLAFVPYLIVDKKMEAIEAFKESWCMTNGYAIQVFLIGLVAIPIAIAGLICFIVGIIPAAMWISLTYASLYHSVSISQKTSDNV